MPPYRHPCHGGTLLGLIIGLVLGLLVALGVAIYVSKVPVPFMNKGTQRSAEPTASDAEKNKDWDPNAPLYGKKDRKSTRLNSSHVSESRMPSSA